MSATEAMFTANQVGTETMGNEGEGGGEKERREVGQRRFRGTEEGA